VSQAWLAGLVLLVAACTSPGTPALSAGPGSAASGSPAPNGSPATTGPSSAGPGPTATPRPDASGLIAVDEGLLRYLPVSIGAVAVSYSAEATADVRDDAVLARNASSIAYGLAIDSTTGDLVVAAVVRLRPDVFDEAFYRGWRRTYDEGACAQAGGVAGAAEATVDGRLVHIGSCRGGAHTYHVFLELPRVMISATSVGVNRFGEQLIANLRL
jgi:hypothetical protein